MFIRSYDGLIAVDQIVLIETPPGVTEHGTPCITIHYRYGQDVRKTRVHPDYVRTLMHCCGDEWDYTAWEY